MMNRIRKFNTNVDCSEDAIDTGYSHVYVGDSTSDHYIYDWTTTTIPGGIYCGRCGAKTYLSADGSHRRCPNCDDKECPWVVTW